MSKGNSTNGTRSVNSGNAANRRNNSTSTSQRSRSEVPLNNISVDTYQYRGALGKEPRGTGNWFFSIGSKEAFEDVSKAFSYYGSYSEALKAAKKEAQKRGSTRLYVMS